MKLGTVILIGLGTLNALGVHSACAGHKADLADLIGFFKEDFR